MTHPEVSTERLIELIAEIERLKDWPGYLCAPERNAVFDQIIAHLRTLSPAAQGRKPPGPLESPSAGLSPDEYRLRKMLAFSYSGSNLYGDDGELQDSASPFPTDYMRDSVEQIETAIYNRGMAALAKHQAALSTDTTEQPRSVQRRIAAQNGLPAPDFSTGTGGREDPIIITGSPVTMAQLEAAQSLRDAPAEQAGDEELTSGAKETLEALDDAAAFFRKEAIYECENMGAGGSSIALGRWKRYYNAIENVAHDIRHPGRSLSAPPLDAQQADTTQARDAWQPIETAPRDGRSVLLGYPGFVTEGYWDCGSKVHLICGLNSEPINPFTHWHKFPASPAPYAAIAKETTK